MCSCRRKLTALPLRGNVLFVCCCTILVSIYLLCFFHIQSSDTWACRVVFHFHPGTLRFFRVLWLIWTYVFCDRKLFCPSSLLRKIQFWFCRRVVLAQIIFYFILEDFIFYWGHRVLHTKWLYKHVHSVHHE